MKIKSDKNKITFGFPNMQFKSTAEFLGYSSCCNIEVEPICGDEGTCHWRCSSCGQPCDLVSKKTNDSELGKMVRDFTKVGSQPKSEVKRRILEFASNREKSLLADIKKNYILKKDSSYVKGYEDCLEEKYDKAQKHFKEKLKLYKAEVLKIIKGL